MPARDADVDIAEVVPDDVRVITEGDRLRFAKQLLLFVGVMCVLIFAAYVVFPENGALANIFELVRIGLLPLVTLVISFYFPKIDR